MHPTFKLEACDVLEESLLNRSLLYSVTQGQSDPKQQVNIEGQVKYIRNFADLSSISSYLKFEIDIEIV